MSIWLATLTVALGAALPAHALAQESLLPTPVEATSQAVPLFPSRERSRGREGWVLVEGRFPQAVLAGWVQDSELARLP